MLSETKCIILRMLLENFFDTLLPFYQKDQTLWEPLLEIKKIFEKEHLGKIEIHVPKTVFLENKELISIGKGTVVEPGAFIRGPCIIGKNCEIRHGAYLRGFVYMLDNCIVGHASEVKNSLMFNGAKASHFAYLGDSILGENTNLGAGVKCANFRLDKKAVSINHNGEVIHTGLKKFGCILGDNVQVGCNTVLSPGTIVGKNSYIYPSICISGVHSKKSRLKR